MRRRGHRPRQPGRRLPAARTGPPEPRQHRHRLLLPRALCQPRASLLPPTPLGQANPSAHSAHGRRTSLPNLLRGFGTSWNQEQSKFLPFPPRPQPRTVGSRHTPPRRGLLCEACGWPGVPWTQPSPRSPLPPPPSTKGGTAPCHLVHGNEGPHTGGQSGHCVLCSHLGLRLSLSDLREPVPVDDTGAPRGLGGCPCHVGGGGSGCGETRVAQARAP